MLLLKQVGTLVDRHGNLYVCVFIVKMLCLQSDAYRLYKQCHHLNPSCKGNPISEDFAQSLKKHQFYSCKKKKCRSKCAVTDDCACTDYTRAFHNPDSAETGINEFMARDAVLSGTHEEIQRQVVTATLANSAATSVAPLGVVALVVYPQSVHHLPNETLSHGVCVRVQHGLGPTGLSGGGCLRGRSRR